MSGQGGTEVANTAPLPQFQSVSRITKLPIVESALRIASIIYGKVKESSRVVNWTLNTAEGVSVAVLAPVASRLETPIQAVDSILGKGIDIVEEKVPAIKMTPQEMLDNTRQLLVSGLDSSGPDASLTARVVGIGVGVATTGFRSAAFVVEWYMDKNFPAEKGEDEGTETENRDEEKDGDSNNHEEKKDGDFDSKSTPSQEAFKVLVRWQKVSRRIQRVMASSVKRQREDITGFLSKVTDYFTDETRPKVLDKVSITYEEMSKIFQDKEASAKETVTKVVHQMTALAIDILGDVGSGVASIPGGLVTRIGGAQRYGMDIVRAIFRRTVGNDPKEPVNGGGSDVQVEHQTDMQDEITSPPSETTEESAVLEDKGTSEASAVLEDKRPSEESAEKPETSKKSVDGKKVEKK